MPLPSPILDDRSFEEIRDELVRRIPVYTPEWTDHNASDPGIALLELFAFLGENLLFRFNQIPEATRIAFLRLLDVPLRPATPAEGLIRLATRRPAGALVRTGSEARAGEVPFETRVEVDVLPLECIALARSLSRGPEGPEEEDYADAVRRARGGYGEGEVPAFYRNVRVPAEPSTPGAGAVDFDRAVDGRLWLAVQRTRHTDPSTLGGRVLNVGFVPAEEVPDLDAVDACPGPGAGEPGPTVVWQGTAGIDAAGRPRYTLLEVVGDTTRGLTREGVVRLRLPADPTALAPVDQTDPELAGTDDFPPVLEDPDEEERVLFWIRAGRLGEATSLGRVRWVGVNVCPVEQARTARPEFLGTGTGQPGQRCALVHAPVLADSLVVEVEEGDRWVRWSEVQSLHASRRDDRHFVVDREAGTVHFGDGTRGRPPQIGERIRAVGYRYGGGVRGNVPAEGVDRLTGHPDLDVANPLPTAGGADDEALDAALERIPGELRRRDRAVTPGDFRELALMTPGADLIRAESLPLFHPPTREERAAGVVSVVVWPREDVRTPDAPLPTRSVLRRVCEWLDRRRLVTSEVWVVPPTYRQVAVSVGVRVKADHGVEAVRRWVEKVLRQYLAPVPPYGPEGGGWPLGRGVRAAELEAAALQVEGVAYLEGDVGLAGWQDDGEGGGRWVPTTWVELQAWEVPHLVDVSVVEGEPLPPGDGVEPAPPRHPEGDDGRPVPVPLPVFRPEC
jgi:hypothetical protein